MSIIAPDRSVSQRQEALAKANAIRNYRSRAKREVREQTRSALEVITNPPVELESMRVYELLLVVRKLGLVKVNNIFGAVRMSPSKTLGGLSDRQRFELVSLLRARGIR